MLNLKKIETGVYSFIHNGSEAIVTKYFVQGYNRNKSEVKSIFVGWGIKEFNTYSTLKEFKKAYSK